ncbi:MAG TPA: alpha-amylase family glycosyl hydrolase [Opitutaceae bacterium]|nr:alpha-amylase family glycosyl hydrolase [Opitutaceae bacterium]
MAETPPKLVRAWLDSLSTGIVEFDRDWTSATPPSISLSGPIEITSFKKAPDTAAVNTFRYFMKDAATICFALPSRRTAGIDPEKDTVYVAGPFNGWQAAVGNEAWRLKIEKLEGQELLMWSGPVKDVMKGSEVMFKFVTAENRWLLPRDDAPNVVRDDSGSVNRVVDPKRTGAHLWRFELGVSLDLSGAWTVSPKGNVASGTVALNPGEFFFSLGTDLPLGALVDGKSTTFRLFAPRAETVTLFTCHDIDDRKAAGSFPLLRRMDTHGVSGVWEVELDRNLHGWFYWYSIEGIAGPTGKLATQTDILDPYALATVDRLGPGIVLDPNWIGSGDSEFKTPNWQDLVIVEAHVRDLAANAPMDATSAERLGFSGLRKWVESSDFYLHHLGINCVELQPIQEFDNKTTEEYHWGYMTNAYFAPESSYSLAPNDASGIREFQQLVKAFHDRGMAVILDVVYNHVGEPAHLMAIDRLYYFEQDPAGNLANWSGCGNDVRAGTAMSKRLIIDSCIHLIKAYGVDGFRFDLAELLGVQVLKDIEVALKEVKPSVILIAEPWSFRGHIAGALRDTGWASWNDGYRNFLKDYVRGNAPAERLEYFLRGSPWYFAKWPAQTVNYTESHDDRTWIDSITENEGFNGTFPTANDVRRTHLMASILFMSIGIPMISAGQDFLRSKGGMGNTYQRGDINALDYKRLYRNLGTHSYFADWISFRRGTKGRLLRHYSRPSEGYFRFFNSGGPAMAVLVNADQSKGAERLLYVVNPTTNDAVVHIGDVASLGAWKQVADQERFLHSASRGATRKVEMDMDLPPLTCGLWVFGG